MKHAISILFASASMLVFARPLAATQVPAPVSAPQQEQCLKLAGLSLHSPNSGMNNRCCKNWERSTCAARDRNGKCIKWNYKCTEWGKPPCRTR